MDLKPVYCSKCKKVVGEIAEGVARFKCKNCGTLTTAEVKEKSAPPIPPKDRNVIGVE